MSFRPSSHPSPKYRSKNAASLSRTVCFFAEWLLFFENRETGGRNFVIAVPVAASIGVLTRFAIEQYRASLLYQGRSRAVAQAEPAAPAAPKPRRSRKTGGAA